MKVRALRRRALKLMHQFLVDLWQLLRGAGGVITAALLWASLIEILAIAYVCLTVA